MKVTFPHLGSIPMFCKAIAETAGIPNIVPPETSRNTLRGYESNKCGNQSEAIERRADHQVGPVGAISANAMAKASNCRLQISYFRLKKIQFEI
jgi:hypothetical protein